MREIYLINASMRKILHNLLKGASLTTALFIFQACYGVPQPALYEYEGLAPMDFTLVSRDDSEPLKGIRITCNTGLGSYYSELGVTGEDGRCHVEIPYIRNVKGPVLRFEDPENLQAPKDTMLADLREREILIRMNPQK